MPLRHMSDKVLDFMADGRIIIKSDQEPAMKRLARAEGKSGGRESGGQQWKQQRGRKDSAGGRGTSPGDIAGVGGEVGYDGGGG